MASQRSQRKAKDKDLTQRAQRKEEGTETPSHPKSRLVFLVSDIVRSILLDDFCWINSAGLDVVDAFDVEDAWDAFYGA